jgi:hypothetical protein
MACTPISHAGPDAAALFENEERGRLFHATPSSDACQHDFKGWRAFSDGNGGEQVCTKCGMGAMHYSLMMSDCRAS